MDILLDVVNLHLNFGALRVTDNVSLRLHKGSRTALIGPNGAGKTTLVNLIAGTLAPQSGTITLLGEDVTGLKDIQRVKRGLVRSFQVTRLFPGMSALDHLAIAILQREGKSGGMLHSYRSMPLVVEEALEVLAMLRLEELATRKVAQIAYGQQRLLEIAIALVLKPKVLLLDEPAAGIPSSDTERVLAALETLPQNLAVLLIDHDMDLVRRFAREVVVLSAGAVIFAGTADKIGSDPRVRSAYLGDETL